ncbi:MAG TPA: regulatory protein RecX [Candidatus Dormibacteraeota bacterium]|nr:regulatory protein RecX [Candidatus Dormibacteraeota bacterium]
MAAPDDPAAAYQRGLAILAGAAQARAALARRLGRAGFTPEAIATATEQLADHGYLDDAAFAASVARRRQRGGRGAALIAQELRRRGVASELAAATVQDLDPDAGAGIVGALAARLAARYPDLPPRERWGRVGAALSRRGHPASVIRTALRGLTEETPAGES